MTLGTPTTPESFWQHAVRVGACLEWRGQIDRGYGRIGYKGRGWRAHRLAWTLARGPIPAGLGVLHTCDNPPCIELLHLFLGTDADNKRDRYAKGRGPIAKNRGELNAHARLTAIEVVAIRQLVAAGLSQSKAAVRFGVSPSTVGRVVHRRNWQSVA